MPLPPGLLLNPATGVLAGTPTTEGSFDFTLRVTDAIGTTRDLAKTVVVNPYVQMTRAAIPTRITTDVVFSYSPAVANGVPPYTYTQDGTLPTGITFTAGTGALSGTPTVSSDFSFSLTITDDIAQQVTSAVVMQVRSAPTLSGSVPHGTVGKPFSATFSQADGHLPNVVTLDSGAYPAGTSLVGMVLSGTPTTVESPSFTLRITDDIGATTTLARSTQIFADVLLSGILPAAIIGNGYSSGYSLSGGESPFTWALASGEMPPGLSLNTSTGVISGMPTTAGTYSPVIRVTDVQSNTTTRTNAIIVSPELILRGSAPDGSISVPYSFSYTVGGGAPPLDTVISLGALPAGLSLSSSGVLTGTPTTTGTSTFTVRVTDANANTTSLVDSVEIFSGAGLSGNVTATATTTVAYSSGLTPTGVSPFVWSISAGALPAGISMNTSTGALTGTPTTPETTNFTLKIVDNVGSQATKAQSIVVAAFPTLSGTLSAGVQNTAYSSGLSRSGGHGTGTWSISAGTLPTGLSINTGTGVISGTPTVVQTQAITVRYVDAVGNAATKAQSIAISAAIGLSLNYQALAYVGDTYSSSGASPSGGTPPLSYTRTAGTLPPSSVLSASTGAITSSGAITTAGVGSFTIRVTDSLANSASASDSISYLALPSWTQPTLDVTNGASLSGGLTGTLGSGGPYTFAGTLGFGLTLASGGTFTGTANNAGAGTGMARTFTVTSTDSNGRAGSGKTLTITFYDAVTLSYGGSLKMTRNVAFSQALTPGNGKAPLVYAIASGALPAGVTLNTSTGVISGTPTATAATYNAAFRATDALSSSATTASQAFVLANQMAFSGTLAEAVVGSAYSSGRTLSGGHSAFTWTVNAGALPSGLSISSTTGVISGTPTTAGTSNFTLRVTDSTGQLADSATSITTYAVPSLSGSLSEGTIGVAYSSGLSASGGKAPLTWSISVGTLPAGLSISSSTGVISGTPTGGAATTNVTVRVQDALGSAGTSAQSITTYVAPSLSGTLPGGVVGAAYSSGLTGSNGKSPLTWSVTDTLPAGLSISSTTGVISGTPTTSGTSAITVRAQDALGNVATSAQSIAIIAEHSVSAGGILKITSSADPVGVGGTSTATVTGGVGPFTYSWAFIAGGTGINLNSTTSATVGATRPASEGFGQSTGTLRCSVTDTGNGNLVRTKDINVSLTNNSTA